MTLETLPAPEEATETVSVEGEVLVPADELRKQEQIIKRNFKKFEAVQQAVARALNIIYYNDLWKLHKTAEGKRRYTNFNDYLAEEFGWDKSAARARQIMKADIPAAIEAGEIPSEVGDKRRDRSAPEITAIKAAKVTSKQLETALDAWITRMDTVEGGEALAALNAIYDDGTETLNALIARLDEFVQEQEAEAETAEDGEVSSEDDAVVARVESA